MARWISGSDQYIIHVICWPLEQFAPCCAVNGFYCYRASAPVCIWGRAPRAHTHSSITFWCRVKLYFMKCQFRFRGPHSLIISAAAAMQNHQRGRNFYRRWETSTSKSYRLTFDILATDAVGIRVLVAHMCGGHHSHAQIVDLARYDGQQYTAITIRCRSAWWC